MTYDEFVKLIPNCLVCGEKLNYTLPDIDHWSSTVKSACFSNLDEFPPCDSFGQGHFGCESIEVAGDWTSNKFEMGLIVFQIPDCVISIFGNNTLVYYPKANGRNIETIGMPISAWPYCNREKFIQKVLNLLLLK